MAEPRWSYGRRDKPPTSVSCWHAPCHLEGAKTGDGVSDPSCRPWEKEEELQRITEEMWKKDGEKPTERCLEGLLEGACEAHEAGRGKDKVWSWVGGAKSSLPHNTGPVWGQRAAAVMGLPECGGCPAPGVPRELPGGVTAHEESMVLLRPGDRRGTQSVPLPLWHLPEGADCAVHVPVG